MNIEDTVFSEPELVCHYTNLSSAFRIVASGELRLGKLSRTNDPFEREEWQVVTEGYCTPDSILAEQRRLGATAWLFRIVRKHSYVLCTCEDDDSAPEPTYACVWGKCYANPACWAHYGHSHRGVGLLLDKSKLCEDYNRFRVGIRRHSGKVNYCLDLNTIERVSAIEVDVNVNDWANVQKHLDEYRNELFLWKHPTWAGENEFRFIYIPDEEPDEDIVTDISGALKGVLFGYRANCSLVDSIKHLCRDYGVPYGRIRWNRGIPWVAGEDVTDK